MADSGLQELLKVVYADNKVGHKMTGKAVSGAGDDYILGDPSTWPIKSIHILN